jgi:hypothetical protein
MISLRSSFLALFGVVWMLFGYSFFNVPATSRVALRLYLHSALSVAPLWVYGAVWVGCGLLALLGALWHRIEWVGFGAAIVMPAFWALVYFTAQWRDGSPRAWVYGVIFMGLAGAIGLAAGMEDPPGRDRSP